MEKTFIQALFNYIESLNIISNGYEGFILLGTTNTFKITLKFKFLFEFNNYK